MSSIVGDLANASSAELVSAVRTIVSELAVRPAPHSGVEAMELGESLGRCIDLAEAALAPLVGRVDATGAHQQSGFSSTTAWLRNALGMRHGRAAERVTVAKQLPRLGRASKLLAGEDLSFGHASAICHATPRLDDEQAAIAEDILLGMVEQGSPVAQVAKAADTITDLIAEQQGRDPEPRESRRGFTRSWLVRSKSLDSGSWVKAWLNPEHTAIFDQLIGPLAKPRARGDDRDLAQRTADALMSVISEGNRGAGVTLIIDLAAYAAATGDPGPFAHAPRTTTTHGDPHPPDRAGSPPESAAAQAEEEAAAAAAAAAATHADTRASAEADADADAEAEAEADAEAHTGTRAGAGAGAGPRWGSGRVPPARLLDGTPISPEDARRIALNAGISALVLGHYGLPLYLGRTVRFVTPAQRKALLALYETCIVHGCQIPAHLCEVHHLDGGWKLGTPTDLNRLAPACGWHNRWIEEHADQVNQTRDSRGRAVLKIRPLWETRRGPSATPRFRGDPADGSRQPGAP